jgi:hypothetical protein
LIHPTKLDSCCRTNFQESGTTGFNRADVLVLTRLTLLLIHEA